MCDLGLVFDEDPELYERTRPGYPTQEYLDVLLTYSNHRAIGEPDRAGLFGCLRELIDGRYGGVVVKRYLYEVRVARRNAVPAQLG